MAVVNFDPNFTMCLHQARKTIRCTFGLLDYRKTVEVAIAGNAIGFSCIEAAIVEIYEQSEEAGEARIDLVRESDGEVLICIDDEDRGYDWLCDMLIAAEIIGIEPIDGGLNMLAAS